MKVFENIAFCILMILFFSACGKLTQEKIKIKLVAGFKKPVIEGQLNGKKGYFLIDTGAEVSFLDTEKAGEYGFVIAENKSSKQFESIS